MRLYTEGPGSEHLFEGDLQMARERSLEPTDQERAFREAEVMVDTRLESVGLRRRAVDRDGHCLFRAAAVQCGAVRSVRGAVWCGACVYIPVLSHK